MQTKTKTRGKRLSSSLYVFAFSLAIVLVGLWLVGGWLGRAITYPRPGVRVQAPAAPMQVVKIPFGEGEAEAWFLPGTQEVPGPALLFLHGNGENLQTMEQSGTIGRMSEWGLPVMFLDFPGYGNSDGSPNETDNINAAISAIHILRAKNPDRPLVIGGWSLGANVAIQAAAEDRVDGVMLLSIFSSAADVGRDHYPNWMVKIMLRESYDSVRAAASIDTPALVIHGTSDQIISFDHGLRVSEAFKNPAWMVPVEGAGHNDLLSFQEPWREMDEFLQQIGQSFDQADNQSVH